MNTFAVLKPIAQYKKVSYYSVCVNDETSLFEDFISTHTVKNKNKLNHIVKWLQLIGDKYGAQDQYFRPEGETADTTALPPTGIRRKPQFTEDGKKRANNLRLYCLRANTNVVILFSGDIKTTRKAQDCPNVKKHFRFANQLTKALDTAFIEKDILWNEDCTDIDYKEDLKIYF